MAQQQQQQPRMFGTSHRRGTDRFIKLQDYINKDLDDVEDTINKLRLDEVEEHINQINDEIEDGELDMEEMVRLQDILQFLEEHKRDLEIEASRRAQPPQAPEERTTNQSSSRGPLIHGGPASRNFGWGYSGNGIFENYRKLNPFSGSGLLEEFEKRRTPEAKDRSYCSRSFANRRFPKGGLEKAIDKCMAERKKEREAKTEGNGIPLVALATVARQFRGHL